MAGSLVECINHPGVMVLTHECVCSAAEGRVPVQECGCCEICTQECLNTPPDPGPPITGE